MNEENYCPEHGPYPASYGSCPECNRRKPSAPQSLSVMEDQTNIGGGFEGRRSIDEQDATQVYGVDNRFGGERDADQTQIDVDFKSIRGEQGKADTEAIFWVCEGNHRGKWYPVFNNTTIGRKKADVILDDDHVSSTHAKITYEKGSYYIWDFGSANGTFVNGRRIREATLIEENDHIKIGNTVFVLKDLNAKKKPPVKKSTPRSKSTAVEKSSTARKKSSSSHSPVKNEKSEE